MNRRLLVVEDEPSLREAYQHILNPPPVRTPIVSSRIVASVQASSQGMSDPNLRYDLSFVSTGEEALEAVRRSLEDERPYVGGFFDVKLGGGIDGIETIRIAKGMDPNLLVVFVTAYQDRTVDEINRVLGDDYIDQWDFLAKPFSPSEVIQKARHLIWDWERRERQRRLIPKRIHLVEGESHSERMAVLATLARGLGTDIATLLVQLNRTIKETSQIPPETSHFLIEMIEKQSLGVRNLLAMARLGNKREAIDLLHLLERAIHMTSSDAREARVSVSLDLAPGLPMLSGSKSELLQVFLNLMFNGIQSMQRGGALTIRAKIEDASLLLEFHDQGEGIPPEIQSKIFEPGFTTRPDKGSGLGLTASLRIVEAHKGTLTFDSQVGRGTAFRLLLPLT